jgi:hypothetical protein
MVILSAEPFHVIFLLPQDVKRSNDLRFMSLTWQALPLYSFQREVVAIRDECAHDVLVALKLEVLTKTLLVEKLLSRAILRPLLPWHIVEVV